MRVDVWTKMASFTAVALVAGVTATANAQARATSQQRSQTGVQHHCADRVAAT